MAFPATRLRRLRRTSPLRDLVRETRLRAGDLVMPLFVEEGIAQPAPIEAMPGIARLPLAALAREAGEIAALGIPAVLLFGIPARKDDEGSGAWDEDGRRPAGDARDQGRPSRPARDRRPLPLRVHEPRPLRAAGGDGSGRQRRDARPAARGPRSSQARAGADVIAPSDMMDGRVGAIRAALDEEGFSDVPILAYSAKFASAFYGPFREAAGSAPASRRPPRLPDGSRATRARRCARRCSTSTRAPT